MPRMAEDAQPLVVPRGTSTAIHPQKARPSLTQDQTVKQAMAPLNVAPYTLEDKLAQICDLYPDEQVTIGEDETMVIT